MMILPLRGDLKEAQADSNEAKTLLESKLALLKEVEDRVDALQKEYEKQNNDLQETLASIKSCQTKLDRASKLTVCLASEEVRWRESIITLNQEIENILGDIVLACGCISYLGPFNAKYRTKIIREIWIPILQEKEIFCDQNFSLQKALGNPIEILDWNMCGLPFDSVSVENIIMERNCDNCALIIDPQKQFNKFIKNYSKKRSVEAKKNFTVTKIHKKFGAQLEMAISNGETLIVENIGEKIDPILDPILRNEVIHSGGYKYMTVGSTLVGWNKDFKIYLISNLSNPHYTPDLLTKVILLDFTITAEGLKEQMQSLVCKIEEPKDEDEKNKITIDNNENKAKLKEYENQILSLLNNSSSDSFVESDVLIISLTESKSISEDIETRIAQSRLTEEKINTNRANYEPVAKLASMVFLIIKEITKWDPMYQFSLKWFEDLFRASIKNAEKPNLKNVGIRVENIKKSLLKATYHEMCRS
jgi:dynein heavy chain